jgi:DNA-binding MarR family transcriptional regulator
MVRGSATIAPTERGPADPAAPDAVAGRLFVALARLTRRLRRDAPIALSHGSITALGTVVNEGALRIGDLATSEGVRAPTMSRIVDGLVADGYAERVPDPADGRACLVQATSAGIAMLSGARTARSQLLASRFGQLSPEQRAALVAALPALEALYADDPSAS